MAARDTWYAGSEAFAALEERMAREIATAARRATLEVARADSCVLTTRAIVAVCARLHLPARPLTCGAVAVNRAWLDCVIKWGMAETPDEGRRRQRDYRAYSVGIGYGATPRPDGLDGHLVAIVGERLLVDGSIDQTNRPAWDLVHGVIVAPLHPGFLTPGGDGRGASGAARRMAVETPSGGVFYEARPEDRRYETSPDWIEPRRGRRIEHRTVRLLSDAGKVR